MPRLFFFFWAIVTGSAGALAAVSYRGNGADAFMGACFVACALSLLWLKEA